MRRLCILGLLVGGFSWGQVNPASAAGAPEQSVAPGEQRNESTTASVPPETAVLIIDGLCGQQENQPQKGGVGASCQTVITRAQFERLADALQPGMSLQHKRELAERYPRLLAITEEAEKRGLDRSARFEELLRFSRLQILSEELVRDVHEKAQEVSEKDIEEYYRRNSAAFEQVEVQRIIVPRLKQMPPQKGVSDDILRAQKKQGEDAMAKMAQELHARAVAGEDFAHLQKEAYQASGNRGNEPPTTVPDIRRANLPGPHAAVFNLKPGEVSQAIDDPNGYYIYKLNRKGVEPLDAVHDEIRSTMQEQRMRDELQKIQQSFGTEINAAYFGASSQPAAPAVPGQLSSPEDANAKHCR